MTISCCSLLDSGNFAKVIWPHAVTECKWLLDEMTADCELEAVHVIQNSSNTQLTVVTGSFFILGLRATWHKLSNEHLNMSDASRLKATLYVGGLDNAVTASTLHAAFLPFGEIVDISLPKPDLPSSTDPHRGFGYVEFELPEDAKEAMDNMDQSELYGRVIKVAAAKPQKEANEGLGSKTAIWEQVRFSERYYYVVMKFDSANGKLIRLPSIGRLAGQERCQRRG